MALQVHLLASGGFLHERRSYASVDVGAGAGGLSSSAEPLANASASVKKLGPVSDHRPHLCYLMEHPLCRCCGFQLPISVKVRQHRPHKFVGRKIELAVF